MMTIRAHVIRAAAISTVAVLATTTLAHADWSYCYAADPDQHRFYVSSPFVQTQPMEAIEAAFRRVLEEQQLDSRAVACPRGSDEAEVRERLNYAASYNRQNGNSVIRLDWSPA